MAKFINLGNGWGKCVDGKNMGCNGTWRLRVDNPVQCPRCHLPFEHVKKKGRK